MRIGSTAGCAIGIEAAVTLKRALCLAATAVSCLVATSLPASATQARAGTPKPKATLAASSTFPAVSGDVLVLYRDSSHRLDVARLRGRVTGLTERPKIELLASPFPFRSPAVVIATEIAKLSRGRAAFELARQPSSATRYFFRVLVSSGHRYVTVATSNVEEVFVSVAMNIKPRTAPTCSRPRCHMSFTETTFFPRAALARESAKHVYTYLGLNLSPNARPPLPSVLRLYPFSIHKTVDRREAYVTYQIRFSFTVGKEGYNFVWDTCTRDTFGLDGLGLPGRHDCGIPAIPYPLPYSGYLG
ncbi:MAG: hypothetical protein M0T79_15220 [Actinomycetota bacterium]|nr:hypothetical protein [Actinomycetota bacterium]